MIATVLLFAATGVFYNPATGTSADAFQQVSSATECADTINHFLADTGGIMHADSGDFYLVQARCEVFEAPAPTPVKAPRKLHHKHSHKV